MLKIKLKYGNLAGQEEKGMEVIVYNSEPSEDGTHISASSIFHARMLKNLSKKQMDALIHSLEPAIEACNAEVERRMNLNKIGKLIRKKK